MKILIVDDSITIRKILKKAITNINSNIEILKADNGYAALELLEQNSDIEYIFLDTLMPGISGKEVLKAIRTDSDLQHIKVIIQTAEHKNEELQYLIDMGITGYLLKPFNSTMLEETLKRWLL